MTPFLSAAVICLAVLSQDVLLMASTTVFALLVTQTSSRSPLLAFAVLYCALYISVGGAFFGEMGNFPGDTASSEHVFSAIQIFLLGFGAMYVAYVALIGPRAPAQPPYKASAPGWLRRDLLGPLCLVLFAPEWLGYSISGNADLGGLAQIAKHVMDFRFVILAYFILQLLDLDDWRSLIQIVLVTVYVGLPLSTTGSSGWSSMIILCVLLASYAFTAINRSAVSYLLKRPAFLAGAVSVLVALLAMALLWEGGLKSDWREVVRSGQAGETAVDRLGGLLEQTRANAAQPDIPAAIEALSARMSSGVGYFSLVLDNLEDGMQHTHGLLTNRALQNLPPRILFPDKGILGSDSELIERYAGIDVAGAEQDTSIGLGFIPELYLDFGLAGMVVACLLLGGLLAGLHRLMQWAAGDSKIGDLAFLVLIFFHALVYDASLAKFGAAIIHKTVVFVVLLFVLRLLFPPQRRNPGGSR